MNNDEANKMLRYVGKQDVDKVILKFISGAFVETCNNVGMTPLMTACSRGSGKLVEFFIERGANVNAQTNNGGRTPLIIAVGYQTHDTLSKSQQAECVQILLNSGANINLTDDTGVTSLMNACWFGCLESVKVLVDAGADISCLSNGKSALDFAMTYSERYNDNSVYEYLTSIRRRTE